MNLALLSVAIGIILTLKAPAMSPAPVKVQKAIEVVATPSAKPTDLPTLEAMGTASYYSREGCVGCSENLHMANGEPLDDSALTVAYNRAPLGSVVKVTNTRNGQSVEAEVTDTGGFERHNRIIDLTIATRDAIQCPNLCPVYVEVMNQPLDIH